MNIAGHVAIVTGGASGLGAQTARALASKGAKVAVFDIGLGPAEAIAKEIGGMAIACDVADPEAVANAIERMKAVLGTARIVVNCAGGTVGARVGRMIGRKGSLPPADFARIVNVNLIGTYNVTLLAAAEMAKLEPINADGERGVVVMVSSAAAFDGPAGQAAYAAAKGGVVALTLPAARDLAPLGIRVMTIAPGLFETPLMKELPEAAKAQVIDAIPFPKRMCQPEEFARLVEHIITNAALNGEVVRIGNGLRLPPK